MPPTEPDRLVVRNLACSEVVALGELFDALYEAWMVRHPSLVLLRSASSVVEGVELLEVQVLSDATRVERILFARRADEVVAMTNVVDGVLTHP